MAVVFLLPADKEISIGFPKVYTFSKKRKDVPRPQKRFTSRSRHVTRCAKVTLRKHLPDVPFSIQIGTGPFGLCDSFSDSTSGKPAQCTTAPAMCR